MTVSPLHTGPEPAHDALALTDVLPASLSRVPSSATGPMEDWTGLDSLVSPAFSLLVFALVCLIESRFPGVDILPFIPKVGQTARPRCRACLARSARPLAGTAMRSRRSTEPHLTPSPAPLAYTPAMFAPRLLTTPSPLDNPLAS